MYFVKTPYLLKKFYPQLIWNIPNHSNQLFLTFDDGPTPDVTENILDILSQFNVKATFFCVGKNVEKFPNLYNRILTEKHGVGNHSFSHQSGWRIKDNAYFNEIEICRQLVQSNLFRPPYGRITFSQIEKLKTQYKIIMWNILSGDFDAHCTPQQCLKNVVENVSASSIVVFHDSKKAFRNVKYALPRFLEYCNKNNYSFEIIRDNKF